MYAPVSQQNFNLLEYSLKCTAQLKKEHYNIHGFILKCIFLMQLNNSHTHYA